MRALALNCTLTASPGISNTEALTRIVLGRLEQDGVATDMIRVVDHDVRPGVSSDEGNGDQWPAIRAQILASETLILATPTWLGNHQASSSGCSSGWTRCCPKLAMTGGRSPTTEVAGFVATGNEDARITSSPSSLKR